jgi:hypothetical protein
MLVIADISGIQDFLFDVQDEGGGQAASLRFRSLRIQLIAEAAAAWLSWRVEPPSGATPWRSTDSMGRPPPPSRCSIPDSAPSSWPHTIPITGKD